MRRWAGFGIWSGIGTGNGSVTGMGLGEDAPSGTGEGTLRLLHFPLVIRKSEMISTSMSEVVPNLSISTLGASSFEDLRVFGF